jgi:hypothetical protein
MIEIPTSIGQLAKLKTLRFYYKNPELKGSLPAELGNLASLESFKVDSSGLTGEIPTAMGNLVNLHTFSLRKSSITGEVPASFAGLTSLVTFRIDLTGIVGEVPLLSQTLATCDLPPNELSCYQSANTVCAGNGVQGLI